MICRLYLISPPAIDLPAFTQALKEAFSGGAAKGEEDIFNEARAIRDGGGNGSIIGRNTFQRPRDEALKLLDSIIRIYKGEV